MISKLHKDYLRKEDSLQLEGYLENPYPDPLESNYKAELHQFILLCLSGDDSYDQEEETAQNKETRGNKSNESAATNGGSGPKVK